MDAFDIDAIETKANNRGDVVVDGRRARRSRNKVAVLDALIGLAREGQNEPAIEVIADRAGVSYRSVYRYFEDRTALMLAAIGRQMEDVWPALEATGRGAGSLDDRIASIVDERIAVYRKLAPLTRVAVHRRVHEPTVAAQYDRVRELCRARIAAEFEPELAAMVGSERVIVLAGIDLGFQFEALDYLAEGDQMNDDQLAQVLTRHIRAHLGAGVVSPN